VTFSGAKALKTTLVTVANNEAIDLERLPVVLGRNPDAGIQLKDRFVSQFHCEISERNGELFVRDLGSKHGSLVNGNRVTQSPMVSGDTLTVGLTSFVVQCERLAARPTEQADLQLTSYTTASSL
jgi:pSer/pThr/pTyr-binding forkhead associated (FHA) protein